MQLSLTSAPEISGIKDALAPERPLRAAAGRRQPRRTDLLSPASSHTKGGLRKLKVSGPPARGARSRENLEKGWVKDASRASGRSTGKE